MLDAYPMSSIKPTEVYREEFSLKLEMVKFASVLLEFWKAKSSHNSGLYLLETPDLTIPVAGSINSDTPCAPDPETFHILYTEEMSETSAFPGFSNKLALA